MKGPVQWLRWRLSTFVELRVRNFIEAEKLSVLRDDLSVLRDNLSVLRDDSRVNMTAQSEIRTEFQSFRKEVSEDQRIPAIEKMMPDVVSRLEDIDGQTQSAVAMTRDVGVRLDVQSAEIRQLASRIRANPFRNSSFKVTSTRDGSFTIGYEGESGARYVDFIDGFRPAFDELANELSYITSWLPTSGDAVDLGAGRGEMLQVMQNHGLSTFGVDSNQSVVNAAKERGFDIRLSDISAFLNTCSLSSLDVITAIQVVEHVDADELELWFEKVHKVLKPGGVFIAETPNPHAIDAFKAFWVDVTHVRPYYPEALLHMAQSAGFVRAEIWASGTQNNIADRLEFAGSYALIAIA